MKQCNSVQSLWQWGVGLPALVVCHVPFHAFLFSSHWDFLVGDVIKYQVCLLYLNGLDLLTSFKTGDIDIEQCVCRGIISWKIALLIMQCRMSLTMVTRNIQASLNGSPESQVIKHVSPINFPGILMKNN